MGVYKYKERSTRADEFEVDLRTPLTNWSRRRNRPGPAAVELPRLFGLDDQPNHINLIDRTAVASPVGAASRISSNLTLRPSGSRTSHPAVERHQRALPSTSITLWTHDHLKGLVATIGTGLRITPRRHKWSSRQVTRPLTNLRRNRHASQTSIRDSQSDASLHETMAITTHDKSLDATFRS